MKRKLIVKKIIYFLFLLQSINVWSQNAEPYKISVSPAIDTQNQTNIEIINVLKQFLPEKDPQFWLASDFKSFKFPYEDLYNIESGKISGNFYKPSVMEIISTENSNKKIVKLAFIGFNKDTESNLIKAIYNVIVNKIDDKIIFSQYIDYATENWKTMQYGNIKYIISPLKSVNLNEIKRQQNEIQELSNFFGVKPFPITYYSSINPVELFQIKGFDYHPMMYVDSSGGFAEQKNIVLSANNSEYYTHEVVHLYTNELFTKINPFLDEGIATYFGGSGKFDYNWQREKLAEFLNENPTFSIAQHIDPYLRVYYQKETPIPYVLGGLICERVLRIYGKKKLFNLLKSNDNIWTILKEVELTPENIDTELKKEIRLPNNKIEKK